MIGVKAYGRANVFRALFRSRRGWIRMYMPFNNMDTHEEEC